MGAYKTRRPFVWQDEMAEVRNLFQRVAKVRRSGFTGFSLWKDEPTAETLSRNRLSRRRCQYALELTHLNYGESPYEALNHLHNIRGMCSRIQRQDRFVERKKKDYDLDLQPALLRRPVTVSYSWSSSKDGSDKASLRSSRPGSAPVMAGTPLHYTPSRPTMLYDATHRCPRYREFSKRQSMLYSSTKPRRSSHTTALKALANNYNWEPAAASSVLSSPMPSSLASSTRTVGSAAPSASPNFRLSADSSPAQDDITSRRKEYLEPVYSEVEITSDASALYSEVESTEASGFSSSRPPSASPVVERPPSRMMSKRPPADMAKAIAADKRSGNAPSTPRRYVHTRGGDSAAREAARSVFHSSPSPATRIGVDGLSTHNSRPPSRKGGDGGRLLDEQRSRCIPVAAGPPAMEKPAISPSGDGAVGLWALRQEPQRPMSAGAMALQAAAAPAAASSEQAHARPATSPTRIGVEHFPRQERVSRFGSSPSTNKIAGKKEQLQVHAVQRAFDQELQQVVLSGYGGNEPYFSSIRMDRELKAMGPSAAPQDHTQQQHQSDDFSTGGDSLEQASMASPSERQTSDAVAAAGDDESHVMIKHSTDPYADFKNSMLRMIHEENLYDKQWELEELFQYYMDLNPAVHHEVLKVVICDIRKDITADKARGYQFSSS